MSNSAGSYRISDRAFWRAYDQLPRSVRERLQEAQADWVPSRLAKLWNGGSHSAPDLIAIIDDWDRHRLHRSRKATRLVYGREHPQAVEK